MVQDKYSYSKRKELEARKASDESQIKLSWETLNPVAPCEAPGHIVVRHAFQRVLADPPLWPCTLQLSWYCSLLDFPHS